MKTKFLFFLLWVNFLFVSDFVIWLLSVQPTTAQSQNLYILCMLSNISFSIFRCRFFRLPLLRNVSKRKKIICRAIYIFFYLMDSVIKYTIYSSFLLFLCHKFYSGPIKIHFFYKIKIFYKKIRVLHFCLVRTKKQHSKNLLIGTIWRSKRLLNVFLNIKFEI